MKKLTALLLIAAMILSVSVPAFAGNYYDVSIEDFSGTLTSYVFETLAGECRRSRDMYSSADGSVTLSIWTNAKCLDGAAADEQAHYLADKARNSYSWCTAIWATPQPEYSNASEESAMLCFIDGMNMWDTASYCGTSKVPAGESKKTAYSSNWLYNSYGDQCLVLCFPETGIRHDLEKNNSGIVYSTEKNGMTFAIWVSNGQDTYWP